MHAAPTLCGADTAYAFRQALPTDRATARHVVGGEAVKMPCTPNLTVRLTARACAVRDSPNLSNAAQGVRGFSPPPSTSVMEELVSHRVRASLQSEQRMDRKDLFDKMDSVEKSLDGKLSTKFEAVNTKFEAMNTKFDAVNTKIDGTKIDISVQAAGFAMVGATMALSILGFFFDKKVGVVDIEPS